MTTVLLLFLVSTSVFLATRRIRDYSVRVQMLDIPGERSAHSVPTPRGGGAAFVAAILAGTVFLFLRGNFSLYVLISLLLGGGAVALVGWMDDRRGLSAALRFGVHCFAALCALFCVGVPGGALSGVFSGVFFFLAIVWLINLYNFMDGIDGLAAGEAVLVAFIASALSASPAASALCLLAGAAVSGFLYWNWSPAKIFMGDVGSGFLGFVFALAWVLEASAAPGRISGASGAGESAACSFFIFPILLGGFIVDATLTLLRRVVHGEKWYSAHNSHAYQRFSRRYGHRNVALASFAVIVFWLAPWAWAAGAWPEYGFLFAGAAYLPMAGAWWLTKNNTM